MNPLLIPLDDVRLQNALYTLGCKMKNLGGELLGVMWAVQEADRSKDVALDMQALRRVIRSLAKVKTLQDLHGHMVRRGTPVTESPDWAAVEAVVGTTA